MTGFSTIVDGTITSPLRDNYDLTVYTSNSISAAYSAAGITDKVGLQVVIYNASSNQVSITSGGAGTSYTNYQSYSNWFPTATNLLIPAYCSATIITDVVGTSYTVSAISSPLNINKGAAGNLIVQTAPSNTGFVTTGTANYVLEGNGTGNPPVWNQLTTGNLAGGVAGSLVWQSAPNTTAKSAVGTAIGNNGGGFAGMTNTSVAGWIQTNFTGGLQSSVYSGNTLTLHSPRAYTIPTALINGSGTSGNLYTWMNANISQYDGDVYTVFNDKNTAFALTIQNIQNPNGWGSLVTSFAGGANVITLYPYETVTFQRYNSTYLTIVSTSQNLGLTGQYNGVKPAGTSQPAVSMQWTAAYDPQGWLTSAGNGYQVYPNIAGNYYVWASITYAGYSSSATPNIQIIKNSTSTVISAAIETAAQQTGNNTVIITGVVPMNGSTDWISLYVLSGWPTTSLFGTAQMTVTLLN